MNLRTGVIESHTFFILRRFYFRIVWWSWSGISFQIYITKTSDPISPVYMKSINIHWMYRIFHNMKITTENRFVGFTDSYIKLQI